MRPPPLVAAMSDSISQLNNGHRTHAGYSMTTYQYCVCLCVVYVFFPFILDIKFVGRTSRGHTGFLIRLLSAVRALIFLARRIQPFLSLVDREIEFCVLKRFNRSPPVAHFYFSFLVFLVRKIPFARIELTSQRVRGFRGTSELPGRPVLIYVVIPRCK